MKIVIAGAGEMGSHLAKMLSGNGHDITIIDADQKLLSDVGSLADVISVEGDSTTFAVLRKAQVRKCDLFIAVNHVENDNVVAAYLRQLEKMGEDAEDYASIWGYTHGQTEPRFGLYVYPDFPFGVTDRVSNLELE